MTEEQIENLRRLIRLEIELTTTFGRKEWEIESDIDYVIEQLKGK